jgi:hypothetical protein
MVIKKPWASNKHYTGRSQGLQIKKALPEQQSFFESQREVD